MHRSRIVRTGLLLALSTAPAWAQGTPGVLRFKVDTAASTMSATVAEPMAIIRGNASGTFRITSGEVQGDPDRIDGTSHVRIVLDAASYQTNSASRDQDVKDHALEVQQFPTITFESTGLAHVDKLSAYAARLKVLGRLTLHGVTKAVNVSVAVRLDSQGRLVADGTYTFKFEEFGVKRPSKMMGLMTTGDEARIDFHVLADPT